MKETLEYHKNWVLYTSTFASPWVRINMGWSPHLFLIWSVCSLQKITTKSKWRKLKQNYWRFILNKKCKLKLISEQLRTFSKFIAQNNQISEYMKSKTGCEALSKEGLEKKHSKKVSIPNIWKRWLDFSYKNTVLIWTASLYLHRPYI